MWPTRRILKYALFGVATVGTFSSLRANQYDLDSVGVVRLGRAGITVLNIVLNYQRTLYSCKFHPESDEYLKIKSEAHKYGAERLLELCCANRGVYIKVGQHIGALEYLLPSEYVNTMKVLHCHAPRSSLEDVFKVLSEDLKKNPKEVFLNIEHEPVGTASLAQVHKATLLDGTVVAVKVQHPSVRGNSIVDMKTMELLVKFVSWTFPDFNFQWLVDETKRNIPIELDFSQEGQNADKVRQMLAYFPWLKVPNVFWELTTPRVLTMEFIEGIQINDLKTITKNKINPHEVSNKLGKMYSRMIFIHGFVHSDPHPGNILVRKGDKGSEIILLDHGLYATLTNEFRYNYARLWLSILESNKQAMKECCEKLGVGEMYGLFACMVAGRSWDAIQSGLSHTKYSKSEKELFQKEIPNLLPQITTILSQVNRQMLLIFKTNDLMKGIEYSLKTEGRMAAFRVMTNCCIQSIYAEQQKKCKSYVSYCRLKIEETWKLFKVAAYYNFLTILSIPFIGSVLRKVFDF